MPRPADTFLSHYDLATLQECMKKGWQSIRALAHELHKFAGLGEQYLGWRKSLDPKEALCRAAENLFYGLLGIGFSDGFACYVKSHGAASVAPEDEYSDQGWDDQLQTWRALAEALVAGRTRRALVDFCSPLNADWNFPFGRVPMIENGQKAKPRPCTSEGYWSELLAWHDESEWNPHTIPLVELLLCAFDEPSLLEELYWRVVTDICLKKYVSELDAIDEKLQRGECLTGEDQGVIIGYTILGSLMYRRCEEEDGAFMASRHYELHIPHHWLRTNMRRLTVNHTEQEGVAMALLVAPAYDLGERWLNSQEWPRYEATCRAPSCGRRFYSGRRIATNCPPAKRGNSCRKEWHRYMRWLEKQRLDAETKWADQSLQQQFSEQDELRTEIRDEQISRAHGIGVR